MVEPGKKGNQKECLDFTAVKRKKKNLWRFELKFSTLFFFYTEVNQPWINNSEVNLMKVFWYFMD